MLHEEFTALSGALVEAFRSARSGWLLGPKITPLSAQLQEEVRIARLVLDRSKTLDGQ